MQGKKLYQEKLFVRFQLSDHVPEGNFYCRLSGILDLNFLYKLTVPYYGAEGQKSIDPVVFMKLMLVGYFENLNSDRRIITTSVYDRTFCISSVMTWMRNYPGTVH